MVKHESFDWKTVLDIVSKKEDFSKDYFISRIKSFPIEEINDVDLREGFKLHFDAKEIELLCKDIARESSNSLYRGEVKTELQKRGKAGAKKAKGMRP